MGQERTLPVEVGQSPYNMSTLRPQADLQPHTTSALTQQMPSTEPDDSKEITR